MMVSAERGTKRRYRREGRVSLASLVFASTLAFGRVFPLPTDGSTVIGEDSSMTTVYADSLPELAQRYSLGYYEIIRANPGVDVWVPGADKHLTLPGRRILPPGPREGIVVNLPEHRLYYYPKRRGREEPVVITYPVSIGKMDWRTPLGETHVIAKIKHPAWYPPESVRKEHEANGDPIPKVVKAGPDNPLGDFAMRLAVGDGTYQRRARGKLLFGHWQWRVRLLGDAVNIYATNALHASRTCVAARCGPIENHLVAALHPREQLRSLRYALDRRQRWPALPTCRRHRQSRQSNQED